MKWAHYVQMGLWGGGILVALDAALTTIEYTCEYTCLQYCEQTAPTVRRIRFIAHPIADPTFNALTLALFGGRVFPDAWTPTTVEVVRDAVIYNGLCFLEAFFCGFLLGVMASILIAPLTERAKA